MIWICICFMGIRDGFRTPGVCSAWLMDYISFER